MASCKKLQLFPFPFVLGAFRPWLLIYLFFCFSTWTLFASEPSEKTEQTLAPLDEDQLRESIFIGMHDVPEFIAIQEIEKKYQVRIFLFGGSAASWANYRYWYERYRRGDDSIYPNRLDHSIDSIYSPLEDMDFVVKNTNGTPELPGILRAIQSDLKFLFPDRPIDLYGWRSSWQDMNGKERIHLFENEEFTTQNLDSQSTTLIELFPRDTSKGIADLKDQDSNNFVRDILQRKIRFFENTRHRSTLRYQSGLNPEILSAIRLLIKAFRYGMNYSTKDRLKLQKIIDNFDPESVPVGSYPNNWILRNSPKLLAFVDNFDYAWTELSRLGFNKKIVQLPGYNPKAIGLYSPFHRIPLKRKNTPEALLRTWQNNSLTGTAESLGIGVITHETSPIIGASITWSIHGNPAIFISSATMENQGTAAFGDGFYTMTGDRGYGHGRSGAHIQFILDPSSVGKKDFLFDRGHRVVLVGNKKIIKLPKKNCHGKRYVFSKFLKKFGGLKNRFPETYSIILRDTNLDELFRNKEFDLETLSLAVELSRQKLIEPSTPQKFAQYLVSPTGEPTPLLIELLKNPTLKELADLLEVLPVKVIRSHLDLIKEKYNLAQESSISIVGEENDKLMMRIHFLISRIGKTSGLESHIQWLLSPDHRPANFKPAFKMLIDSVALPEQLDHILPTYSLKKPFLDWLITEHLNFIPKETNTPFPILSFIAAWKHLKATFSDTLYHDFLEHLDKWDTSYVKEETFKLLTTESIEFMIQEVPDLEKDHSFREGLFKWAIKNPLNHFLFLDKETSNLQRIHSILKMELNNKKSKDILEYETRQYYRNNENDFACWIKSLAQFISDVDLISYIDSAIKNGFYFHRFTKETWQAIFKLTKIFPALESKESASWILNYIYHLLGAKENKPRENIEILLDILSTKNPEERTLISNTLSVHSRTFSIDHKNIHSFGIYPILIELTDFIYEQFGKAEAIGFILPYTANLLMGNEKSIGKLLEIIPEIAKEKRFIKNLLDRIALDGLHSFNRLEYCGSLGHHLKEIFRSTPVTELVELFSGRNFYSYTYPEAERLIYVLATYLPARYRVQVGTAAMKQVFSSEKGQSQVSPNEMTQVKVITDRIQKNLAKLAKAEDCSKILATFTKEIKK